jgi:hypothetical protein
LHWEIRIDKHCKTPIEFQIGFERNSVGNFTIKGKPNIKPGLLDQTSIALNLFNTILQIANNQVELERSWEVIERDISIQEN